MNAALLTLVAVAIIVLAVVNVMHLQMMAAERHEWADERRLLVDRAIAAHTGEVLALDNAHNRVERDRDERPLIEGLS